MEGTPLQAGLEAFRERIRGKSEMELTALDVEKDGVFLGAHVVNPVNGEEVPVWTANFVLSEYGTGAVMAVPAHDQRDFEFARKYGLPIRVVVDPPGCRLDPDEMTEAYEEPGTVTRSGGFDGIDSLRAREEAVPDLLESRGWGRRAVNYRLRDWLISRQRYWGAPSPPLLRECGTVPCPRPTCGAAARGFSSSLRALAPGALGSFPLAAPLLSRAVRETDYIHLLDSKLLLTYLYPHTLGFSGKAPPAGLPPSTSRHEHAPAPALLALLHQVLYDLG